MKVILQKDVKAIGRTNDIVEASNGHALNFLIPQKLAIPATPGAIKEANTRRAKIVGERQVAQKLIEQNLATLAEARVVIKTKSNEKDHLYDAINEPEILSAIKEQANVDLPEGSIRLDKAIKELGTFDVPVSVGEIFGKFSITVEAE